MFNQFKNSNAIRDLKPAELDALTDEIATFLAQETRFDVETIIKNINVLETTLALHKVFDLTKDRVVFDGGQQVMTHKILTGRAQDLALRTNIPLTLDATNPFDAYTGGDIGEGLGVGLAYALDAPQKHTIVVIDDHALNYGLTYETLVQISKEKPNIIIVMIDEQQSLLRHYTSMNTFVKSIRISKTYTGLKKDMKTVLDSNPISRPILNTLVRVRDALKETVLEPTIFTQFGIDYQGPIDGQNISDLVRVFEMAKTMKGPNLIHVQTRLRKKQRRKLEFPNFKLDDATPDNYKTYHEIFDSTLVGIRDPKLMLLVDALNFGDYFSEFAEAYPNNYVVTSGSTESLVTLAAGYVRMGYRVVVALSSQRVLEVQSHINNQFKLSELPLTLLIRGTGLNSTGNRFEQGVYDIGALEHLANVYMPKDLNEASGLLNKILQKTGINAIRYQNDAEKHMPQLLDLDAVWEVAHPFDASSEGVILTFGTSIQDFIKKIEANSLNIGVVNTRNLSSVDSALLQKIAEFHHKILIYNIEDIHNELYHHILRHCYEQKLDLEIQCVDLRGLELTAGSKELKRAHHLHIDDAIRLLIEGK